jgi:hypothetical protein
MDRHSFYGGHWLDKVGLGPLADAMPGASRTNHQRIQFMTDLDGNPIN